MAKTKKQRVADYLSKHPGAKIAEVVKACKVSSPTVSVVKKELGLTRPRRGKKSGAQNGAQNGAAGPKKSEEQVLTRLGIAAQLVAAAGSVEQAKRDVDTAMDLKDRLAGV